MWVRSANRERLLSVERRIRRTFAAESDHASLQAEAAAGKFILADVGNLSTSQFIAALAPGARVVKALNTMIVPTLEADPVANGARRVAFISSDDEGAKKEVGSLLASFGYSVIDLGNLRDGGLIQQAGGPLAGRTLLEEGERHR